MLCVDVSKHNRILGQIKDSLGGCEKGGEKGIKKMRNKRKALVTEYGK